MEKQILNELLDRYERSKLFREGASSRRILIDASANAAFSAFQEQADSKREFLAALDELKGKWLIDYSWVRFEKGNLVDRVWLCTEAEALAESYRLAGRAPKAAQLEELGRQIEEALAGMAPVPGAEERPVEKPDDLRQFLLDELEEIRSKKAIPRFFFQSGGMARAGDTDRERNRRLLRLLAELRTMEDDELERVLSTRLYGDSKYFERELRPKLLQILRHLAKRGERETPTDEELLEERGIFKWPEILEFRGAVSIETDSGAQIDYRDQIYGAYINSTAVRHIARVQLHGISRILSIENKANYTWYLSENRREDELVLYHGGFFSPVKGNWFRKIAAAAQRSAAEVEVLHWSDIDLGGFRIFRRLREEIFPQAKPWRMDVETLETYRDSCISLGNAGYRELLARMKEEPACSCFADTIAFMLEQDVRLEQEAEI